MLKLLLNIFRPVGKSVVSVNTCGVLPSEILGNTLVPGSSLLAFKYLCLLNCLQTWKKSSCFSSGNNLYIMIILYHFHFGYAMILNWYSPTSFKDLAAVESFMMTVYLYSYVSVSICVYKCMYVYVRMHASLCVSCNTCLWLVCVLYA